MKTKYIYFAVAALMITAVVYPLAYASLTNSQRASNPFFCAPLIPCQKQPPGTIICSAFCTVEMKDSTFVPGTINATQGSTIEWVNEDGYSHTVTTFNSSVIYSPVIPPGGSFNYTIPKSVLPGTYYYFCSVHPFMIGLINVLPANSSS